MLLTDACAILPSLKTDPADTVQEAKDLRKLALWCQRYTPCTASRGPDAIALDVTGACHLQGGEQELLDDLLFRLRGLGFTARAAMAGSFGAAWALSNYGSIGGIVVPSGEEARFLDALPVQGLRLDDAACALLKRLGLTTIGQLLRLPRGALRARLGLGVLLRLNQALGEHSEPLSPFQPEKAYAAHVNFAEPISALEHLAYATEHLATQVTAQLKGDAKGARRFKLAFYDTQGGVFTVAVALAKPGYEQSHVLRLFREKFAQFESRFDENLAFDAASLYAARMEPLTPRQSDLADGDASRLEQEAQLAALLDRLSARLGSDAVTHFDFRESHLPERAAFAAPILDQVLPRPTLRRRRPLLLLPRAEPVTVMAEVPDYPPRRFTWRRVLHKVVKAEGPERLSPEWWPDEQDGSATRDYYTVEDESGRRFWLYREGYYQGENVPRWFMHGVFA